jgi:hypothetical protein
MTKAEQTRLLTWRSKLCRDQLLGGPSHRPADILESREDVLQVEEAPSDVRGRRAL